MSEGKAYTEAEVVAARQEAFVSGARAYWTAYDASDTGFPLGDMTGAAKIRYPDPKRLRVETIGQREYRVVNGALQVLGTNGEWQPSILDEEVKALADLLANPFEASSK